METPSDNPPIVDSQNPATMSQPAAKDHDANPEATRENSPASVFVNSEPVREEQVENAVKFLSHPRVKGSPVMYRRSFLERKGLTKEEIDEAFRRVPDPTPTVSTTQPVSANEDEKVKSPSTTQALSASQNLQFASAQQSNTMRKRGYFSHFHWIHAVMAVGIMAASGAGTALLLKHTIIPRFKSWIRKVVMEEEDEKGTLKGRPSLAEEAAVAAKAAAAAAVDVARASQAMLASKTEEKRYFEELTNLLNYQVREMKSMSSALQKLEVHILKCLKCVSSLTLRRSFCGTYTLRSFYPIYAVVMGKVVLWEEYLPWSEMIKESISYTTDINDQPPNPYQPVPNPRFGPKPKPWEIGQNQNSSRSFFQSQGSGDGLNYEYQDSSTPWWQRKSGRITVTEAENEEKFGYTAAPTEVRPVQRSWVPPQPPPVAMAEAAAAIRQPKKSLFQKEKLTSDELMASSSEMSDDDLQRITKISESGGLTETNSSGFGQQLSGAPVTNGDNVLNS
ncbi:hypothetical protein EJD97_019850 [Solanum chilense]|uniref:Peroxisomal membrane protein PEX14 n=1 Tax=Solanum chilense TaxID=4083 RepID=A0A6N2C6J8_SOLCI|nr:hypothetical protein EJD97_019850 [Solanum chilense]